MNVGLLRCHVRRIGHYLTVEWRHASYWERLHIRFGIYLFNFYKNVKNSWFFPPSSLSSSSVSHINCPCPHPPGSTPSIMPIKLWLFFLQMLFQFIENLSTSDCISLDTFNFPQFPLGLVVESFIRWPLSCSKEGNPGRETGAFWSWASVSVDHWRIFAFPWPSAPLCG